ncbi:hypothetical protein BJ875DRAFT_467455 [Amylocarpus encephaloides]|uniref:Uncharacterized protein n=1 Tax=Amylocarpus encephaloides TaxID=45428 RepID=A0A9P7YFU9_9HELO|nr:hypothetical protein BJ875DRAFT_467455 [Amylocarpus encephaloides]
MNIYPDVFAPGDSEDIEGASLPTRAEVAVQKAKCLVNHLNHKAEGKEKGNLCISA